MISIIVNDIDENLKNCFSKNNEIEIFCLNDSNLTINEEFDDEIKFVNDYDDFLNQIKGDYVLFLKSSREIVCDINELMDYIHHNNLELFIPIIDNGYMDEFLNKPLSNRDVNLKFLFKNLDNDSSLIIEKSLLKQNKINFYADNSLFLLNSIIMSERFEFSDKQIYKSSKSQSNLKLDISNYYEVINNIISDRNVYEHYSSEFWKYIFGKIFDVIYNMSDESVKRKYFYDSKILFDDYSNNKGYYRDIFNSVDIMVLEFFKQSLMDVCYISKKREVLKRLVNEDFKPLTLSIKSDNQNMEYEKKFKKYLEHKGFEVLIHQKEEWYGNEENEDIVLILRNSYTYVPNENHINVIWNINDEKIPVEEYDSYDVILISSKKLTDELDGKIDGLVEQIKFSNEEIKENCNDFVETIRNITL